MRVCQICNTEFRTYTNDVCLKCKKKARSNSRHLISIVCSVCGKSFKTFDKTICQPCRLKKVHRHRWQYILDAEPNCVYCGQLADTIDHIHPQAYGGQDIESNLVSACRSCNCRKNDHLLTNWPDKERLAHALARSAKVRAEYARLTSISVIRSLPSYPM